ncbi:hypothetical protein KR222_010482, partial [Zaprionus bogoriensis]
VVNLIFGMSIRLIAYFAEPSAGWLAKPSVVFSTQALNHEWGVSPPTVCTVRIFHAPFCLQAWPVFIISAVGFALEILAILRLSLTRDDVWYTKAPAACEIVETRKGYTPPSRKVGKSSGFLKRHENFSLMHTSQFLIICQKYKNPDGLVEAWQGYVDGPPN